MFPRAARLALLPLLLLAAFAGSARAEPPSDCVSFKGSDGVSENFCGRYGDCYGFTYFVADGDGTSRGQGWAVTCGLRDFVCWYQWNDWDQTSSYQCVISLLAP